MFLFKKMKRLLIKTNTFFSSYMVKVGLHYGNMDIYSLYD